MIKFADAHRVRFAVQNWIAAQSAEGKRWKVYLLTFMFEPLPGGKAAMHRQMQREIEHFYTKLLTRVVRNPNSPGSRDRLPRLFAAPDRPVPKRDKLSLDDVRINEGLHYHALVLIPRKSRLRTGLKKHVATNEALYHGKHGKLRHIHVARVKAGDEATVSDYAMKRWKRDLSVGDDLLILPRAVSELPESGGPPF